MQVYYIDICETAFTQNVFRTKWPRLDVATMAYPRRVAVNNFGHWAISMTERDLYTFARARPRPAVDRTTIVGIIHFEETYADPRKLTKV